MEIKLSELSRGHFPQIGKSNYAIVLDKVIYYTTIYKIVFRKSNFVF